jgi:hypothetical protein
MKESPMLFELYSTLAFAKIWLQLVGSNPRMELASFWNSSGSSSAKNSLLKIIFGGEQRFIRLAMREKVLYGALA